MLLNRRYRQAQHTVSNDLVSFEINRHRLLHNRYVPAVRRNHEIMFPNDLIANYQLCQKIARMIIDRGVFVAVFGHGLASARVPRLLNKHRIGWRSGGVVMKYNRVWNAFRYVLTAKRKVFGRERGTFDVI